MTISGAEGNFARRINGTYVPVDEGRGVAYRQAEDPDWWLEWYAPTKKWYVTTTEVRGTSGGWAYLLCDPPRLPTDPRGAKWQVDFGTYGNADWRESPGVKCVTR